MAILQNVRIFKMRCDPKRPSTFFDPEKPTWSVQIRTTDPQQKAEWEAHGVKAKLMIYPEGHEREGEAMLTEDGKREWRATLRKRAKKQDGTDSPPVEVKGGNLIPLDPLTVGDGSVGNVRLFQYTYGKENKTANVLVGVQIRKLRKVEPRVREDFEAADMEFIEDDEDFDAAPPETAKEAPKAAASPAVPSPAMKPAEQNPEDAY
jgi:hypothetical protein